MKTFQQRFIYYDELNNLHEIENKNSWKFFRNFVREFANEQNINEINSLNVMKKSLNNLIIIEDNKTKNRYWINDDEKYINSDKYKKDDEDENEYERN